MVYDLVVGAEHSVREPVIAHELPHILLRIELRALRWDRDDRDVCGHLELRCQVPSGRKRRWNTALTGVVSLRSSAYIFCRSRRDTARCVQSCAT